MGRIRPDEERPIVPFRHPVGLVVSLARAMRLILARVWLARRVRFTRLLERALEISNRRFDITRSSDSFTGTLRFERKPLRWVS